MQLFVTCDNCGTKIRWDSVHTYETPNQKIYRFCDECCPRCKVTLGEAK